MATMELFHQLHCLVSNAFKIKIREHSLTRALSRICFGKQFIPTITRKWLLWPTGRARTS